MNVQDIYGAYRKAMAGAGSVEVLKGDFTDEEAHAAIRGISEKKEDLFKLATIDVGQFLELYQNKAKAKLQIKAECNERGSYLIYLNFVII